MKALTLDATYYTRLRVTAAQVQAPQVAAELIYCPFYLFQIRGHLARRFLPDLQKREAISVDGVKGFFAQAQILDAARLFVERAEAGAPVWRPRLDLAEAWRLGLETLRKSHSYALQGAFWLNRRVEIEPLACWLIYKPYWRLVQEGTAEPLVRVIDATSGETGGQSAYRFLQAYELMMERS